MPIEPSENLHATLSPLTERLLDLPKSADTLGYLVSIASVITEAFVLLGKTPPTVVGGLAVEMYTSGGYTTLDVDMIVVDDEIASNIMNALGFRRRRGCRYYEHPKLGACVEFPSGPLEGSSDRVNRICLDDGTALYVISPEDIILDRIAAYVHWDKRRENSADATQAVILMVAQQDRISREYLQAAAEQRGLAAGLADIVARVETLKTLDL